MKKITLSVALLLFGGGYFANAQVGIGTPDPASSSMLDIVARDKGVLIPRVSLTDTTKFEPVTGTEVESLMVYNTAEVNDVTPGYYYWFEGKWSRVINADDLADVAGPREGDVIYVEENNEWIFKYYDGTTYEEINFEELVQANESKTLLVTSTDGKFQYYVSETYLSSANNATDDTTVDSWTDSSIPAGVYLIDFVEGVANNLVEFLETVINIEVDGTTYVTVEDYIKYITESSLEEGLTKIVITDGQAAFHTWNATDNKWELVENTAFKTIVTDNETKTQIMRSETVTDGTLADFEESRTAPTAASVKKGEIIYQYNSEDSKDYINLTEDMITSITNNEELQNAINNIIKEGGNVSYTTVEIPANVSGGAIIPANSFYYTEAGVMKEITLGDTLLSNTAVKTQDTFDGNAVYIYNTTTTMVAGTAKTNGVDLPTGVTIGKILSIRVVGPTGTSSVTDVAVGSKINFNMGSGTMYNVLPSGVNYDVIIEFAAQ